MRTPRAVIGAVTAVLLSTASLAGCTVTKQADAATASGTASSASAWTPPTVTNEAPGVTADTIKIGYEYYDLSKAKELLGIDHGDYQTYFQALVDDLNAKGGINGRKIEVVYGKIDPLSDTAVQETCTNLTEDQEVFAVLGVTNDQIVCFTQTHHTAIVGGDITPESFAAAKAPWLTGNREGGTLLSGISPETPYGTRTPVRFTYFAKIKFKK